MKTKEELKQLALDICEGRVFGSWQIDREGDLPMVFMSLMFMSEDQMRDALTREVVDVYEYLDKAGPRSMNGMPCFFSHQELTKQERELLKPLVEKMLKMREEFANG